MLVGDPERAQIFRQDRVEPEAGRPGNLVVAARARSSHCRIAAGDPVDTAVRSPSLVEFPAVHGGRGLQILGAEPGLEVGEIVEATSNLRKTLDVRAPGPARSGPSTAGCAAEPRERWIDRRPHR